MIDEDEMKYYNDTLHKYKKLYFYYICFLCESLCNLCVFLWQKNSSTKMHRAFTEIHGVTGQYSFIHASATSFPLATLSTTTMSWLE